MIDVYLFLRASAWSFDNVCGLLRGCLTNIPGIPVLIFAEKHKLHLSCTVAFAKQDSVIMHTLLY